MNTPTKAITIRDPWAQAIVHGPKRVENRSQRLRKMLGERVAVHVSQAIDRDAWRELYENRKYPGDVPKYEATDVLHYLGHIIGSVRLIGWVDSKDNRARILDPGPWADSRGVMDPDGHWVESAVIEHVRGDDWWQGPVGWLLDDVIEYRPVEARGMPGFWTVDEDIREKLEEI